MTMINQVSIKPADLISSLVTILEKAVVSQCTLLLPRVIETVREGNYIVTVSIDTAAW